jgi:hypothetical protein
MNKEQIINAVIKSGCKMMEKFPLDKMSREDLIYQLGKACCPVLKKLCIPA